jgi:hypothetical protein
MDTFTTTTRLINNTTAKVKENSTIEYFTQSRKGLSNTYSLLGLIVSIETTKQRGWNLYESEVRVAYSRHIGTPDGFSDWFKDYKTSFGSKNLSINTFSVERPTPTRLQEAHNVAVIAGELHVLTIINKYVELLFNAVDKELITRQINELQSQLATLTTTN